MPSTNRIFIYDRLEYERNKKVRRKIVGASGEKRESVAFEMLRGLVLKRDISAGFMKKDISRLWEVGNFCLL